MNERGESMGTEKWHGTSGGTSNHGCKCPACRKAWTAYCKKRRAERAQNIKPDDPRHGLVSFYFNHSCRCDKCKAANTKYARELRLRNK